MGRRFYHAANRLLYIAFRIGLDLQVSGVENIPATGPLIVAINHSSFIDPLLVGVFMPRDVVMMSKSENFALPFWGPIVKWYGAFAIQRGEVDREAIRKALEVLRNGEVLLMAPEGTRSMDGQLQPGHDGLALIATRTRAPILPFAIAGARPASSNLRRLRRTRVRVNIGKPFTLEPTTAKPSRAELAALTNQVMIQLARLLPVDQRGVYRQAAA